MPMRETDCCLEAERIVLKAGRAPLTVRFRPGEIVGLAGLDGHGQEVFLEVLAGWRRPLAGEVRHSGRAGGAPRPIRNFRDAMRRGVAYLPRDRRRTGIFPALSILDNFAIASLNRDTRIGFISPRIRRERYSRFKDLLSIVADDPRRTITTLSGGNQQKVLLARLLVREPDVLLLNDPTRGVDVATRQLLYGVFKDLALKGMTIVILSSEIEEAIFLSNRVLVFRDSTLSAELSGVELDNDRVISAMFGRAA